MLPFHACFFSILVGIWMYGCTIRSFSMESKTGKGIGYKKNNEDASGILTQQNFTLDSANTLSQTLSLDIFPLTIQEKILWYLPLEDLLGHVPYTCKTWETLVNSLLCTPNGYFSQKFPYEIDIFPEWDKSNFPKVQKELALVKKYSIPHVRCKRSVNEPVYAYLNTELPKLLTLELDYTTNGLFNNVRGLANCLYKFPKGPKVLTGVKLWLAGVEPEDQTKIIEYLSTCINLEYVKLEGLGDVGNNIKKLFKCEKLISVDLMGSNISDETIKFICALPNLKIKHLIVSKSNESQKGISEASTAMLRDLEHRGTGLKLEIT